MREVKHAGSCLLCCGSCCRAFETDLFFISLSLLPQSVLDDPFLLCLSLRCFRPRFLLPPEVFRPSRELATKHQSMTVLSTSSRYKSEPL